MRLTYEQAVQTVPSRDERLTTWMLHLNECGLRTEVTDFVVKVPTAKSWLDVEGHSFIAACQDYAKRRTT